ncbi:hypothetical protein M8C21_031821, partial [Ambrosia artemisiifolia]
SKAFENISLHFDSHSSHSNFTYHRSRFLKINLENEVELLQRYRRDRRILLNYLLSGSLIKKVVMPPGAVSLDDVDLDQELLLLNEIATVSKFRLRSKVYERWKELGLNTKTKCGSLKRGEMLELSEAIRDYHDSTGLPQMNAESEGEFFLATNPESSGSPPRRAPPAVPFVVPSPIVPDLTSSNPFDANEEEDEPDIISNSQSINSGQDRNLTVDDIDDFEDEDDLEELTSRRYSRRTLNDTADLVVGLPSFATGVNDDDLRETAYEILLAAAGASGGLIVPSKEKKKEKKSRLLKKLGRSKSEQVTAQSQQSTGLTGLLETMRVQMEISEAMDIRTRQGLLNAMAGKVGKRMDALLIPLELLSCVSRTEFSDKKAYIRWQKRQAIQLNMLEEGLVNHPVVGFGESGRKASEMRVLLARIEESESFAPSVGELQRIECLRSLREIAIPLAERPARGDLTGEVCHWADGYHLNVRLYEKLLLSVFDVLDEGKLTECHIKSNIFGSLNNLQVRKVSRYCEVEEILELLKSTWRILGITETIHHTCYAWVLFRQFVMTREHGLLRLAIEQLNKVPMKEERGPQERMHLKGLYCKVENEEGSRELTFLQSFLMPIQKWADRQLADYHLHFSEQGDFFRRNLDRRESGIKAFVKKELNDPRLPDMRKSRDINILTTPTLCVQLNTLYVSGNIIVKFYENYGISHLNKLEDSIWERWTRKTKHGKSNNENSKKESFDGSRKDINAAIDRICEFTGTKIIFWDLREPFIENLYRPSVSESRLETLIEPLDVELNQLCDVIVEPLRDRIVTSLLQASLDGLLRVLLDGGPSRLFIPSDAKSLEEDLEVLKEFFISGGDGLPRGVVENQVARVRQVIKLQGYEGGKWAGHTRELIDDLKSASASDRSKLGADTKTLLRILCHRCDSEASQFLKKQYKIPKSAT